jgi:hypothetical protein
MSAKDVRDEFTPEEARKRFEAALRDAHLVGHKPQSEMKLGKPRGKKAKSPARAKAKTVGKI